ncbi:Ig-like domain-containing protein [Erwinia typographi]|nr:Ig-like domain-containing protein [Erwinia typographi]
MEELKGSVNDLADRKPTDIPPPTFQQDNAPPTFASSPFLSTPSSQFKTSADIGPFGTHEGDKTASSSDIIAQLPSLEGSKNSLSEQKSLFLDDDINRSREADSSLRPLEGVKQFWQVMGTDNRTQAGLGVITGIANDMASNALRDWMGQSGNTRLQFNSQGEASADLLVPFWDAPDTLLFSQQGIRVNKERTTWNLGLGVRHYVSDDFMLGLNSFYDRDVTGNNARFSVGAEAWTHFLKLSANKYQRLTDWHQSPLQEMEDYDERPANGFDVAADAWLPFYPQFGASVKYEKYFGKGIILDNSSSPGSLQDSPSAVTTTLNYTPIPLLTFKAGRKSGSSSDSFVGLDINYRLGVSWNEQTDKETIRVMRSLPGARYDFVDRNYNIVMQYRKQNLISLSLPSSVTAEAAATTVIEASVRAKYGLKKIDWRAPELLAAGGTLTQNSATSLAVRLPKYLHDGVNSYKVSAIATDNHGNESPESTVIINLVPHSTIITLDVKPVDNIVANGVDFAHLHAKVTGKSGEFMSDHNVRFVVSGINDNCILKGNNACEAQHVTDTSGMAIVPLASTKAGKVTIFSHLDNGNRDIKTLNFIADGSTAELAELTVVVNNAVANGKAANKAKVIIADYYGNPISNAVVSFSVDGAATLSSQSVVTDDNGSATVDISSKLAGNNTLTASASGMSKSAALTFIADIRTAKIDDLYATPATELKADGADTTILTAVVKDANGNIVSGANVIFSASDGAKLSQKSVTTDSDGLARVNLTSTVAGSSTVTAVTAEDKIGKKTAIHFIGDITTGQVDSFTASPSSGMAANDNDASELKAWVKDANGNAVSGVLVTFSVNGKARLSQGSAVSGIGGLATVSLTSTRASSSTVTASTSFDPVGKQVSVSFAADQATARVVSFEASPVDNIKANGIATSTLTAVVKDANDNLVSGATVKFEIYSVYNKGKLSHSSAITDSKGVVTIQTSSTVADFNIIRAYTDFEPNNYTKEVLVDFIADSDTAQIHSLTAVENSNVKANGTEYSVLTAIVKDNYGNILNGATVTFRVNGSAQLSDTSVVSGVSSGGGKATVRLTSKLAGSSTVTAVTSFDKVGKQTAVSFVADASTASIVSLSASPAAGVTADGTSASLLKALVKDVNGNTVSGATVTFSVSGKASLKQTSVITASDGYAAVQLVSTSASSSTVTAVTAHDKTGKQATVGFVADISTAKVFSLSASPESGIAASGNPASTLTTVVKDTGGNLVSGVKVTFKVTGMATLSQASAVTDDKGQATVTISSTAPGRNTVTASTDNDSVGKQISVSFVPDISSAKIDSFTASPEKDVLANGLFDSRLTAKVKDANGNSVGGVEVTFSVSGKASLNKPSAITDFSGTATVRLTSTSASSSTVTAVTDFDKTGKKVSVSYIADYYSARIDSITATPASNITADGSAISLIKVQVKDPHGNIVSGENVTFRVEGQAKLLKSSAITDKDGFATVQLISTTVGNSAVSALISGKDESRRKKVTVTFVADLATAKIDSLYASPTSGVTANGVASSTLTAQVKDANGNLVSGATVTFSVDGNARLDQPSAKTGSNGVATVRLSSSSASSYTVTATTSFDKTGKQAAVAFVADASTAKVDSFSAFPSTAQANGRSQARLQAVIKDTNGNLVRGVSVSFTASGGAKLSSQSAVTNGNGVASVDLTNTTAGNSTVTATTPSDRMGKSTVVTFVADAETASIDSLTASPATGVKANGLASSTLTARVKDAHGNIVSNATVVFNAGEKARLSQPSAKTDSSGLATVQVTNTTAESSLITAVTAYDTNGKRASVGFIADISTAGVDSINAVPAADVTANGTATSLITALVKDTNGNLVSGAKVMFSVEGKAALKSVSAISNSEGKATVSLSSTSATSSTVTALTDFNKTGKKVSVSFKADIATATVDSLKVSKASGIIANGKDASLLTAVVKDTHGNTVSGAKVTFSVNGKAALSQQSAITNGEGIATVSLTSLSASLSTVTAKAAEDVTGKQASVAFIADLSTAKVDSLAASPSAGLKADGTTSSALTALVKDANGNLVSNATVNFSVNGSGKLDHASATTGSNGNATVNLTSKFAGNSTVIATITGDDTTKQATVTFIADITTAKIDRLIASPDADVTANDKATSALTALVTDANGNLVSNAKVTFSVNGLATLKESSAVTGSDGSVTVNLSSKFAGVNTVTAVTESDKIGKKASVTFVADLSTSKIDSLTASPATGIAANGKAFSVLTAVVKDANGNLVSNANVLFNLGGNGNLSAVQKAMPVTKENSVNTMQAITGSDGTVKVFLTSPAASVSTVTATTVYDKTGKQVSVTFIADISTATIDSLTATPVTDVLTDGKATSILTARVKDANGNILSGAKINFSLTGNAELSQLSAVSNGEGTVEISLSSKFAGNVVVSAVTDYDKVGKKAFVSFIANKNTAAVIGLTATPATNIPANGVALSTITALVQDANANPVSGVKVTFSINGKATLNQLSAITDSNGFAKVNLTSTVAGSSTVSAVTDYDKTVQTVSVIFIADLNSARVDNLTATPAQGIAANGIASSTLTALVKDADDNPVSGATVNFTITDSAKNQSQSTAITGYNGIATTLVNSTVSGNSTVRATIEKSDDVGKTVSVGFIGDSQTASVESLTASPTEGITADGKSSSTLSAVVKDAKGNLVNGAVVLFKVSGQASLSQPSAKTGPDGIATVNLTSTLEGSSTVTATTGYDKTGKPVTVSFVAGDVSGSTSTLQLSKTILPADAKSSLVLTLTAKDQFGNKTQGANITFSVTNAEGVKISAVTEKEGVYTATLTSGDKAAIGKISVQQNKAEVKDLAAEVGIYSTTLKLVVN